jgi:hypothetical protein
MVQDSGCMTMANSEVKNFPFIEPILLFQAGSADE